MLWEFQEDVRISDNDQIFIIVLSRWESHAESPV